MTGVTVRDDRVLRLVPLRAVDEQGVDRPFVPEDWIEAFPPLLAHIEARPDIWTMSDDPAGWFGKPGAHGIYYDPEYDIGGD